MSFSEKGEGRRNFAPRNICLPRVETHYVSQLRHRKKKGKDKDYDKSTAKDRKSVV